MNWQNIPDIPLQLIFEYLSRRDRFSASICCKRWHCAFFNPQLWRTYKFTWRSSNTDQHKRLYNIKMFRLYLEFATVGRHFRYIIVPPNGDFYALHGFLQQWRQCIDSHEGYGLSIPLQSFHLTFACEIIGNQAFGTGGRLLDTLKEVLGRMQGLRFLVLDDLLLDVTDALSVLDEVIFVSSISLRRLSVVSICKEPAGFYAAALFPNLQVLRLSPTQLNTDVLDSLVSETQLTRLVLRQNKFTLWPVSVDQHPMQYRPPSEDDWRRAIKRAPWLRVRLEIAGIHCGGEQREGVDLVMWPSRFAPVDQVFFTYSDTSSDGLTLSLQMVNVLADYSSTLAEFGYTCPLETMTMTEEYEEHGNRVQHPVTEDALVWFELASVCRNIHTLYMPNRVVTWLLVLLAGTLSYLSRLYVRRNMVYSEPMPSNNSGAWRLVDDEVKAVAKDTATSVSHCEREVAFMLQQSRWHFLSDVEFQRCNPTDEKEFIYG